MRSAQKDKTCPLWTYKFHQITAELTRREIDLIWISEVTFFYAYGQVLLQNQYRLYLRNSRGKHQRIFW